MESSGIMLLAITIMVLLLVGLVKLFIKGAANNPTWKGIIISALFGMLLFYLIFCFLGWMGEERRPTDTL